MAKAVLNLAGLSIAEKIAKCDTIVQAMTGNINFATPNPDLKSVQLAIDQLTTDYENALNGGTILKKKMALSLSALMNLMTGLCAYVQSVSMGDEGMIISSGIDLKRKPTPSTMDRPANFRVMTNGHDGSLKLAWKIVRHAKSYIIQMYAEPAGVSKSILQTDSNDWDWVQIGVNAKTRFDASDLLSGSKYWFRGAAVGASGTSGWSNVATMIAP